MLGKFGLKTKTEETKDLSFLDFSGKIIGSFTTNLIALIENPIAGVSIYDINNKTQIVEFNIINDKPLKMLNSRLQKKWQYSIILIIY